MSPWDIKARVGQAAKQFKRSETAQRNAMSKRDPLKPLPIHFYLKAVPSVPSKA